MLATQPPHLRPSPDDLLAFKAHLAGAEVPAGSVILAPFPGGYAGLVERAPGRATFAACVRREVLKSLGGKGDSLLDFLRGRSSRLRRTLECAALESPWLAAGPLRPGRRPLYREGILALGNAAGEAHPVIGEGIAMAMQSAAFACEALCAHADPRRAAREYAWRWRRRFSLRLWASARFAGLAMRPVGWSAKLLGRAPQLLTAAALISGKT